MSTSDENKKHVVVIGGGFGGLAFLKAFKSPESSLTLLDKRNHHLFQPLLYQVATTGLSATDIAQPLRSILSAREDITVLMDEVRSIDLDSRTIHTAQKSVVYDYLIIAAGASTTYFGNEHWAKRAPGLKSLGDARQIRNTVLSSFEKAEAGNHSKEELESLMTMVVVGGGPTGVEMAGSLAELSKRVIKKDFRKIDPTNARVILVEAADRVLSAYPESLSASAKRQLEDLGVEVRLNQMVQDIREGEVELADGSIIKSQNICWTAGIGANPLTKSLDLPKDRAGRLLVEADCSLPGYPEVFAIGDIINLTDSNGTRVPGVAQGAIQAGKHVAKIIHAEISGKTERPAFKYINLGEMATIGRNRAVAKIGKLEFSGFIAWMMWLVIHLAVLVGLRNKISVFLNWIFAYLAYKPGARIIWKIHDDIPSKTEKPKRKSEQLLT